MSDPFEYVDQRFEAYIAELADFCRLPSWGVNPEGMRTTADWLSGRLARLGFATECIERVDALPLVWARRTGRSSRPDYVLRPLRDRRSRHGGATGPLTRLEPKISQDRLSC